MLVKGQSRAELVVGWGGAGGRGGVVRGLKRRRQRNQVIDVILEFSNDDNTGWEQGKVIALVLVLKALRMMGEHTED